MESSSWSVVLASPSLAIVESFSLSVSTEELTSVPGTSLQPNKAIINHEDKISIGSETKIIPRCIRGDEGEVVFKLVVSYLLAQVCLSHLQRTTHQFPAFLQEQALVLQPFLQVQPTHRIKSKSKD